MDMDSSRQGCPSLPSITDSRITLRPSGLADIYYDAYKGTGTNSIAHWVIDTYPIIYIKRSGHARRDDHECSLLQH